MFWTISILVYQKIPVTSTHHVHFQTDNKLPQAAFRKFRGQKMGNQPPASEKEEVVSWDDEILLIYETFWTIDVPNHQPGVFLKIF